MEKPSELPALQKAPHNSLRYALGKIEPPEFIKEWNEGTRFRLFTYSLRHNELAGWEFKIFPDGRMEMEKIFSFSPKKNQKKQEKPIIR